MVKAALCAFLVWLCIHFLEKKHGDRVDGWISIALVVVTSVLAHLFALTTHLLGLPLWVSSLGAVFYFVIPALLFHYQIDIEWKRAWAYGGVVLLMSIISSTIVGYGYLAIA